MELIDNISKTLKDDLSLEIKSGSKIAIAASCFSIYAFKELKEQFKSIEEFRFIFTSPTFTTENVSKEKREFYIPKLNRERGLLGTEFEVKLRNELSQKAIARECADWIRKKACFKSNKTNEQMTGFLTVDNKSYMPLGGFTTVELGCERGNMAYTIIGKYDYPESQRFLQVFNEFWNSPTKMQVVTEEVIENISNAYKENSPDFIYFITLYNIFNEFLEDLSVDDLPNELTGFKSSAIWGKLFNFQKDAALAIINKLEKYNGCILADSVGLGKTYTALAVIKYYENRNKSVLVLCPKKLNDNWMTYRSNYKNNPIAADRLRYDVLFHSDLSRKSGKSNGMELSNINWGNYDMVVIDESHNFRNGGKVSEDDEYGCKENRYLKLMNRIIKSGVKTKVLMLSATPVNNRFNDLKNQIQLAYEGEAYRMDLLLNTNSSIDVIFRRAQTAYNEWARFSPEQRTTNRLLQMLDYDFFELLDSVTIARSRKHIERYYDTTDIGTFPNRLAPISRRPVLTDINSAISFKDIFEQIQELNLFLYTPSAFILESKRHKYIELDDDGDATNISVFGREMGIKRLMGINLLKRLESSVNSFRLTLKRIKDALEVTLLKINEYQSNGIVVDVDELTTNGYDLDNDDSDVFIGNKKNKILLEDMDYIQWKEYLEHDLDVFNLLLTMLADITPEHDSKLQQLYNDICEKINNPINNGNKKILVFTAFSDTAEYLYTQLATKLHKEYGVHVALVTGDVEARSTLKLRRKLDFNTVLTLFSPMSKEKNLIYPEIQDEIDILIATDCISEGQNLQDCDYLINYDIHWNPVRIIQRFGRIDRIGSKNADIQLVNYWPDLTLDEYIDLKGRVEARMKITVMTATGDDNPISPEEKGDLEYRKAQLQRLQEEVVDIEEMNTGISIMDLGLNEFRLDLLDYMKKNHDIEHTPFGLHAVVAASEENPPGVIFVLKNRNNGVNIDHKNRLHPFYLVYIADDGNVVVNHLAPKELLDKMRLLCKSKTEHSIGLCRSFNKETHDGAYMKTYSKLLSNTISSIVDVKEKSDIDSFLSGVQTELFTDKINGLDDFELICFLVIK